MSFNDTGAPLFQPEPHRGYLAGLHPETVASLLLWFDRDPVGVQRTLERSEVQFRGADYFVCTLGLLALVDGVQGPVPVLLRSMQPTWDDAVRNALHVARLAELHGLGIEYRSLTLEQWLAWQDEVRP